MVIQIDGNSYRLRQHAGLMPENLMAAKGERMINGRLITMM